MENNLDSPSKADRITADAHHYPFDVLRKSKKANVAGAKSVMGTRAGEDKGIDKGHVMQGLVDHGRTLDLIGNAMEF